MLKLVAYTSAVVMLFAAAASAQDYVDSSGNVKVVIVKDPYTDSRSGPELLKGPDLLANGGLPGLLRDLGCEIAQTHDVKMPEELERQYGEWNRASLTNRTLGKIIYGNNKDEYFLIGLLSGSKSLVGMLAGLQHLGPGRSPLKDNRDRDIIGLVRLGEGRPLKVGLVWIDSKAAFNTPDITLEGDMGGMNVAVAAGICNRTLRLQAGLDPPLSTRYIVMAGVRNVNPYEQVHIDNSFIETLSVDDIRSLSDDIDAQMARLSELTDVIYVHVDMSVLDPAEIPGHPQAVPGGPTSKELAACLEMMFKHEKAAAIGIASLHDDADETSIKSAYTLIEGAIRGVKGR